MTDRPRRPGGLSRFWRRWTGGQRLLKFLGMSWLALSAAVFPLAMLSHTKQGLDGGELRGALAVMELSGLWTLCLVASWMFYGTRALDMFRVGPAADRVALRSMAGMLAGAMAFVFVVLLGNALAPLLPYGSSLPWALSGAGDVLSTVLAVGLATLLVWAEVLVLTLGLGPRVRALFESPIGLGLAHAFWLPLCLLPLLGEEALHASLRALGHSWLTGTVAWIVPADRPIAALHAYLGGDVAGTALALVESMVALVALVALAQWLVGWRVRGGGLDEQSWGAGSRRPRDRARTDAGRGFGRDRRYRLPAPVWLAARLSGGSPDTIPANWRWMVIWGSLALCIVLPAGTTLYSQMHPDAQTPAHERVAIAGTVASWISMAVLLAAIYIDRKSLPPTARHRAFALGVEAVRFPASAAYPVPVRRHLWASVVYMLAKVTLLGLPITAVGLAVSWATGLPLRFAAGSGAGTAGLLLVAVSGLVPMICILPALPAGFRSWRPLAQAATVLVAGMLSYGAVIGLLVAVFHSPLRHAGLGSSVWLVFGVATPAILSSLVAAWVGRDRRRIDYLGRWADSGMAAAHARTFH